MTTPRLYAITVVFTSNMPNLPGVIVRNTITNIHDAAEFLAATDHLHELRKGPYHNVLKFCLCTPVLIDDALAEAKSLIAKFVPAFLDSKFLISEEAFFGRAQTWQKQAFTLPKNESTPHLPPVC